MDDYLLKVKIQNNKIVSLMRKKGLETIADLARASGISQSELGKYINMTKSPLLIRCDDNRQYTDKPWSITVLKLADFFGVLPDEMFNDQQIHMPLETNQSERTIDQESLQAFLPQLENRDPEQILIEDKKQQFLKEELEKLAPKYRTILTMMFGLNGEPRCTLEEIGLEVGLTRERVRQISRQGMEIIRNKSERLQQFMEQTDLKDVPTIEFALTSREQELIDASTNPFKTAYEHGINYRSVWRYLKDIKKYYQLTPEAKEQFDYWLNKCRETMYD